MPTKETLTARTEIKLRPTQKADAQALAKSLNISLGELFRDLLDTHLKYLAGIKARDAGHAADLELASLAGDGTGKP